MSQFPNSSLSGQRLERLSDVLFQDAINELFGVKVVKFDRNSAPNQAIMKNLRSAMRDVCSQLQTDPIERPRPNEVGNDLEQHVIDSLANNGLEADRPKTKAGKGMSAGYPDVVITHDPVVYLEVKSYNPKHHGSTPRSFFFSYSDDPKVTQDGYHLAVGFEMQRDGNLFRPTSYTVVDLHGLLCDLKSEFNSNNKRLYEADRVLAAERVQ